MAQGEVFDASPKNIDARTTRHPGYAISQQKRKLVEQGFGWNVQLAIWLDAQPRPIDLTGLAAKVAQWLREEAPKIPPATAAKPT